MQRYPTEAPSQSWQAGARNAPNGEPGYPGNPGQPYDDQGDGQLPDERAVRRAGLVGWWLNLTSPPRPPIGASTEERERIRRAELTSLSILAVAAFLLALVSNSLADPSTGQAVGAMAIGLIIAAILNRTGTTKPWRTSVAAILVPGLMLVLLMGAVVQAKGGLSLIWLPAYDLMAIPIIISSLTARWRAPWVFAVLAIGFVVADFTLQPHALLNGLGAQQFDSIAYETQIFGYWGMINRHVALMFFAGLIGSLGARSVEGAIHRADRAEEIAAMEHQLVEQKRQLEYGIQQILATHVRVANGDFGARAPLTQDNVLFQIAASLNNLLNRLSRAGQAEYVLQRTATEIERLRESLLAARAGRQPLWPMRSGTPIDRLIEVLAGPGSSQQPPSSAMPGMPGMPSMYGGPSGPGMAPFPASGPFGAPTSGPLGPGGAGIVRDTDRFPGGYAPPAPQSAPRWQQPNAQPFGGPQMPYQPAPQANPWETQAPSPNHPTSAGQLPGEPPQSDSWGMPPLPDVPD